MGEGWWADERVNDSSNRVAGNGNNDQIKRDPGWSNSNGKGTQGCGLLEIVKCHVVGYSRRMQTDVLLVNIWPHQGHSWDLKKLIVSHICCFYFRFSAFATFYLTFHVNNLPAEMSRAVLMLDYQKHNF